MIRQPTGCLKNILKSTARIAIGLSLGLGMAGIAQASPYKPPVKPISIDDLAKYDAMTNVVIAPDGKHIAALIAAKGQEWPVISIWDTSDLSKTPIWIPSKTQRIISISFFGSNKVSFISEQPINGFDGRPTFTYKLYYADLDGRNIQEPFKITGTLNKDVRDQMERGISATVFNDHLYDASKILMATVDTDSFVQKIFELDTTTGKTRTVALGSEKGEFLETGVDLATGEPLIKSEEDNINGEYWYKVYIKNKTTGEWVYQAPLSYQVKDRKNIDILGFDADPSKLIIVTNSNSDHRQIYSYDIASQTYSKDPLYASSKYDLTVAFKVDRAKRETSIVEVAVQGPALVSNFVDDKWSTVQASLQAAFPGQTVSLNDGGVTEPNKPVRLNIAEDAPDTAVVTVDSPDHPPQYYLYKDGKVIGLGGAKPWIDPATLGKPEFIVYKARDGLEIPAFITYPTGWTPDQGPVPLIVLPHGGPWARDQQEWDPTGWPQFFATRGIAVIQPQYRGSEGWGDKLWKAGDNEWGQKMSDDNDDAAAYMVAKGVADPKRMALFGYSYGGFAAMAASVRPNSPYRCAIAGAGVSSLQRIGNLWGGSHVQRDIQGHTVSGMDPLKNVAKANIPIMLFHGDHDRQADTDHSRMFFAAMKAAGKDIEYTEIKGMRHTLPWHVEWQQQSLGLIENYLKSSKCGLIN